MKKNPFSPLKEFSGLLFITTVFIALSCGKPPSQREKPVDTFVDPGGPTPTATATGTAVPTASPTVSPVEVYQLQLFGAPWCGPCNEEIPELDTRMSSEFKGLENRVAVTVNVEYGTGTTEPPSPAVTEQWRQKLNVPAFKFVTGEWKLKNYKKYFKANDGVPTAVILSPSGEVVAKYIGKHTDEMIAKLHELVK